MSAGKPITGDGLRLREKKIIIRSHLSITRHPLVMWKRKERVKKGREVSEGGREGRMKKVERSCYSCFELVSSKKNKKRRRRRIPGWLVEDVGHHLCRAALAHAKQPHMHTHWDIYSEFSKLLSPHPNRGGHKRGHNKAINAGGGWARHAGWEAPAAQRQHILHQRYCHSDGLWAERPWAGWRGWGDTWDGLSLKYI